MPLLESQPEGLIRLGNIDLSKRPILLNPDGSKSTIESMSVNFNGVEWLIPTIVNGKRVARDRAINHFLNTGEHLGAFVSPQFADAYAKSLSEKQGLLLK